MAAALTTTNSMRRTTLRHEAISGLGQGNACLRLPVHELNDEMSSKSRWRGRRRA